MHVVELISVISCLRIWWNVSRTHATESLESVASNFPQRKKGSFHAAKAWLEGRDFLTPEDLQAIYRETMAHRVFFSPIYKMRRGDVARALIAQILEKIRTLTIAVPAPAWILARSTACPVSLAGIASTGKVEMRP
jgi:hypothetical protein